MLLHRDLSLLTDYPVAEMPGMFGILNLTELLSMASESRHNPKW